MLNGLLSFLNVAKHPPTELRHLQEKFASTFVGTNCSSTFRVKCDMVQLDSTLFRKTCISFQGDVCLSWYRERPLHGCPLLLFLLHGITVTCSTHHVSLEISLGVMCLEVERGAASWPFVIRVMWDPYDESVWVRWEGWWVYMRYWSFLWPLMVVPCSLACT